MLVRSVPLEGGACDEVDTGALGTLLLCSTAGAPRAGLDLPCRSGDADLWFAESPAELERAKALCGGCPVRVACLAGALQREEPWGVWGGEIFERGRRRAAQAAPRPAEQGRPGPRRRIRGGPGRRERLTVIDPRTAKETTMTTHEHPRSARPPQPRHCSTKPWRDPISSAAS